MTFDEYENTGRVLYAAFAKAVGAIIEAAIVADGSIRLQQLQDRAKVPSSLRQKLVKAGVADNDPIEDAAKDLAGCRLVLYSNSDVTRMNNARILFDNFDIVWERTKLHFPHDDQTGSASQFIGDNYVVRLKKPREALPEYSRFAGLLCEVQVQTILNHAWSETAHDTIYKRPTLNGVGARQLSRIESRMKDIQQKYLLPAGYEFQQVLNDFERLSTGQRLIDGEILTAIRDATDNNALVELLKQYKNHVLPLLDDPESACRELRAALLVSAEKAFKSPVVPIETPIGTMSGRTAEDVVEETLSILGELRFVDPAAAFEALVSLYCGAPDETIREKIRKAVESLAKHSLVAWRKVGPAVQEVLLDAIGETPSERLGLVRPLMIEVAGECLAPEVTGTSSTSSTFTWETGAVSISDRLNKVRDRAMRLLMELFQTATADKERRAIFSALKGATRLPNHGQYGDALLIRALQDSAAIVAFLTEHVGAMSNEFRESIEDDILFLFRRNRDMPGEMLKDASVVTARDELTTRTFAFRDALNGIPDFVIFKTLVGYETVFLYEWDQDEGATNFEAKRQYRKERIVELLNEVNVETADEWFERLNRYAAVESDDLATFPHLGGFIADIATNNPAVASNWLARLEGQPLEKFRPGLLRGLYASDRVSATSFAESAIEQGRDLSGLMQFLRWAEPVNPTLLEKCFLRSVAADNAHAVYKGLEAAVERPEELELPLARRILLQAIEYLDRNGHYRWTDPVWTWGKQKGLLAALSDEEVALLLRLIGNLPKIDFRAEEILAVFAERFPEQVLEVFGQRLAHERQEEDDEYAFADPAFEAIPFDFSRLHKSMGGAVSIAVDRAFEWSREDGHLVEFKSARLIAIMFPDGSEDLAKKLSEFVQSGARDRQEFVVSIMKGFKGQPIVFAVMRELVAVLPSDDQMLRSVRIALSERGVMHGEFGYRDALIDQKSALQPWLGDEREPVRSFAEDAIRSLDNEIAAAQRSAQQDIAMRRLEYGEPLTDAPNPRDDAAEAESQG